MPHFRWKKSAAALAMAALATTSLPASAQFSNTYFFGDSLTDNGSYKPVVPPGTGLFTTNPGPVWAQFFADHYGTTAAPSNQGGTDYAYGGARVTQHPGFPDAPPTASAVPIAVQVQTFLASGAVDRNALYSVWGGANDIFVALTGLAGGTITQAQAQSNVSVAATELVGYIGALQAAGANYMLVWNLPDIGKTPFGQGSGNAAGVSALTGLYNSTLTAGLNQIGGNVIRVNVFGFLNEVIANPSLYGIQNVTTPACGATPSLVCTAANLVTPDAATTYLFADAVHPTTAGHEALAQLAESYIDGPSRILLLGEAPLAIEAANFRAVDARMQSAVNTPYKGGKFEAWASYDYAAPDNNSGSVSSDSNINTVNVGGDMKLSDELLVGLQFGYSQNKTDFGDSAGSFKLNEAMGTVYAGWGRGPWWAGATAFAGDLEYKDVRRNIQLLAANRVEQGSTNGYQYGGRLMGGYLFNANNWVHGPYVNTVYQQVKVRAFSEDGSDSTALSYGQQDRDSWETGIGWQAAGQLGAVRPFARVRWQFEAKDEARQIAATPISTGGTYTIGSYKPDNNWALFNLGASTDFGRVTGYLVGTATAAKSDGNGYSITLGIRAPL